MESTRSTKDLNYKQLAAIIICALIGLFALGRFDPLPERAIGSDGVFLYFGPEGETIPEPDVSPRLRAKAEAALDGVDYYGAFAIGASGETGVWTGAWSGDLARTYALAACGRNCTVIAQRLPLHRDPTRTEPVATRAMAQNLAVKWPFNDDHIAIGGAGAWGHRSEPAGKGAWRGAMRDAAADCETRRASEAAPSADISPPCRVQPLREIEDLRPKPNLYPADFTLALTDLVPVSETTISQIPGAPPNGWIPPYLPPRLHGARAANGASSFEVVRAAGWPEAGKAIALLKCNAELRPGETPCQLSHIRGPDEAVPQGLLAVTPELFESFVAWQETGGSGAFAVSPYGVWGFSYNHSNTDEAIQKAADWCWYYTRKNWEYRQVDRAFLDAGLSCRVVAVRAP